MNQSTLALVGRVSGTIKPGRMGEVMLPIRGGYESFYAYAMDPNQTIREGTRVIVIEEEPPRIVRVQPY